MKTYVIDIDGTICISQPSHYENATPIYERISQINSLYENGNFIIYFTARGMGSTDNNVVAAERRWLSLTKIQLDAWGAKYHQLFFGKPAGDHYIDDKAISDQDFFIKKN